MPKRLAKPKPELEGPILADCLKYLNKVDGIWAWRRNVGAAKLGGRWIRYGQSGMADISGIISVTIADDLVGVRLEVEVKAPGNTPTPKQAAWLAATLHHGGVALWCDSKEALDYKLRKAFNDRGWTWPSS